ncbi:MAG: flagellar hook protein FlgE [Bacillota bacterium]|nr:flagellar hook protein FlgE [Bacillota bacterium]
MMRSLYSGVSGLKNLQTKMDVIGNNIANVNTPGFKKSRVIFQDKLYQSIRGAAAPDGEKGGTNPMGIGMGMTMGSIDQIHTPAPAAATNRTTDMAIDGNGYFVVKNVEGLTTYTRTGAFDFDEMGNLHTPDGSVVQGWVADENFVIDTSGGDVMGINVSSFKMDSPKATSEMDFSGNLNTDIEVSKKYDVDGTALDFDIASDVPTGKTIVTSKEIYDSLGNKLPVYFRFFRAEVTADDPTTQQWLCDISLDPEFTFDNTAGELGVNNMGDDLDFDDGGANYKVIRLTGLEFDTSGHILSPDSAKCNLIIPRDSIGAENIQPVIDFSEITQFQSSSTAWVESQNGCEAGTLKSYTVGQDGVISGVYDNGELRSLARVALATFQNPGGLTQMGGTMFSVSKNSGDAQIGAPADEGMGAILPGSLEMSNVDISEEFTEMIVTQRGFQANSRIITSSDEMLQELVNLKR